MCETEAEAVLFFFFSSRFWEICERLHSSFRVFFSDKIIINKSNYEFTGKLPFDFVNKSIISLWRDSKCEWKWNFLTIKKFLTMKSLRINRVLTLSLSLSFARGFDEEYSKHLRNLISTQSKMKRRERKCCLIAR